jgi:hypothetical protein
MMRIVEASRRADEPQREHAQHRQPPSHDQQRQEFAANIDGLPVSEHKRAFLKAHPEMLTGPLNRVMAHHCQLALHAGIADDTEAMDQAVLAGVHRDIEHHRQLPQPTPGRRRRIIWV